MSTLFSSPQKNNGPVRYTGISLQTSSQGQGITVVYGRNRVPGNLIWFNDFKSYAQHQSGGKGGGEITSYTYSVACIMALCEGPVQSVLNVFFNQNQQSLSALNLTPYIGTDSQTPPAFITSNYPLEAESYANTAYVFSSRLDLGSSPALPSLAFEIDGMFANTLVGVHDANPGDILEDFLTNNRYGLGVDSSLINSSDLAQYKTYCQAQMLYMSPVLAGQEQGVSTIQRWAQLTNSLIFWGGTEIRIVPLGDAAIIAHGATYTPNLTVEYQLGYDQFVVDGDTPPLRIDLASPYNSYNRVQVDTSNRDLSYSTYSANWFDQTFADRFGDQDSQVISAPDICVPAIGDTVAALIGQRLIGVRKTASFALSFRYMLLQPGDIVGLTDPNIGISGELYRIIEIEESEDLTLQIKAEELALGIGSLQYTAATQSVAPSNAPDILVDQGDSNTPCIIEPDLYTTGGVPYVWILVSGGENWGGCSVYLSIDDVNYTFSGQTFMSSFQGVLTAPLPAHPDPDAIDTLSIDTTMSKADIPLSATPTDADLGITTVVVGDEVMAYGFITAGPGTYDYSMMYLRRGLMGTTITSHSIGELFTSVDSMKAVRVVLQPQFIGVPLFVKVPSFNRTGGPEQSLADVSSTIFVPTGVVFTTAPPTSVALSIATTPTLGMRVSWVASNGGGVTGYEIQFSTDGGASFTTDNTVGSDATEYVLSPATIGTPYQARVRALAYGGSALSDWVYTLVVTPTTPMTTAEMAVTRRTRPPVEDTDRKRRR